MDEWIDQADARGPHGPLATLIPGSLLTDQPQRWVSGLYSSFCGVTNSLPPPPPCSWMLVLIKSFICHHFHSFLLTFSPCKLLNDKLSSNQVPALAKWVCVTSWWRIDFCSSPWLNVISACSVTQHLSRRRFWAWVQLQILTVLSLINLFTIFPPRGGMLSPLLCSPALKKKNPTLKKKKKKHYQIVEPSSSAHRCSAYEEITQHITHDHLRSVHQM